MLLQVKLAQTPPELCHQVDGRRPRDLRVQKINLSSTLALTNIVLALNGIKQRNIVMLKMEREENANKDKNDQRTERWRIKWV